MVVASDEIVFFRTASGKEGKKDKEKFVTLSNEANPHFMTKLRKSIGEVYEISIHSQWDLRKRFALRLPLWLHLALLFLICIGLIGCGYLLTAYTPLKFTIEGYPTAQELLLKKELISQINALEKQIAYQDSLLRYFALGKPVAKEITPNSADKQSRIAPPPSFSSIPSSIVSQKIESITTLFPTNEELLRMVPPIKGVVSRSLNLKEHHFGIDIATPAGKIVHAAHDGMVILSDYSILTGWIVVLMSSSGIVTVYKHNQESLVEVGDRVVAGMPIAISGGLGKLSTGSHLHFEVWERGKVIDPLRWFPLPRL